MGKTLISKLRAYALLMRLHQPVGFFLLLWPTLWAFWIASAGHPNKFLVFLFCLGALLIRSAGCVINDIADRHFDKYVARTKNRPLVTGMMSIREAFLLFSVLFLLAFLLTLFMNRLTIMLAFIGAFLAIFYPFTKRFTHLPQSFLGLAFAWGVPMAFAAQTESVPLIAWYVYLIAGLWTFTYDTIYAMVDREDDKKIGIKSTALLFNNLDILIIFLLQIILLFMLIMLGKQLSLNQYYYASLLLVPGLFIYQQILIKQRDPKQCFKAFLNNQWVGLVVFLGLVLGFA